MNQTTQRSLCVGGLCLVVAGRDSHWDEKPKHSPIRRKTVKHKTRTQCVKKCVSRARAGA